MGDYRIESTLRRARPAPRPGFASELESRLFPPARRRQLHPLFAAAAVSAAFALAALVLSLAGVGPLGGSSGNGADAHPRCAYTNAERIERVPGIEVDRSGHLRIVLRRATVKRRVKSCGA